MEKEMHVRWSGKVSRALLAAGLLASSMWSAGAAAAITTIGGGAPLQIILGDDAGLQVLNSDIPGSRGQFFPSGTTTDTASAGWFIGVGTSLFDSLGLNSTPLTPVSITPVTGAGTDANPFRVTSISNLGTTGLQLSVETRYSNGHNFFTQTATVSGATATTPIKMFFGADLFLATSDSGVPFRDSTTFAVGGTTNCAGRTGQIYQILFIPQTPATSFTANGFSNVFSQISGLALDGQILVPANNGCIDNGAALQWDRTVQSGRTTSVNVAVSFGEQPPAEVLAPSTVTVQGQSGKSFVLTVNPGSISATVQPPPQIPPGDLENVLDSLAISIEQIAMGASVTLQVTLPDGADPDTAFICRSDGTNCVEINFTTVATTQASKSYRSKAGKKINIVIADNSPQDPDADPAKIGGLLVLGSKKAGGGGGGGGAMGGELLLMLLGGAWLRRGIGRKSA